MRGGTRELSGGRNELIGYTVLEMAAGRSLLEWTPGPALSNPVGMVHGGFVAVVVDDTCGTAVSSTFDELRAFPTASMHLDFLRGIAVGGTYRCTGEVVRQGRRLTVADTSIHDLEGRLLARGTCTFAVDGPKVDGSRARGGRG